ncbi:MAG: hypothetical protein KJ011_04460 [Burkholderiaceae bacterium]|nr:hypothetical protein [Burkholderiaceae bacterium]
MDASTGRNSSQEGAQFEVLSPWADAEPVALRGLSPRLEKLEGKQIGLFINAKRAAKLTLESFERQLLERAPGVTTSWYTCTDVNVPEMRTAGKEKFAAWISSVDAVVLSIAD